jgi:hypothetical protein
MIRIENKDGGERTRCSRVSRRDEYHTLESGIEVEEYDIDVEPDRETIPNMNNL